jgi:mycothiol synthase
MDKKPLLPSDLRLRAAQWADSQSVADLILAVCTADGDPTLATTEAELINYWKDDRFVLETDAWVVENTAGQIVAYQEFFNRHAHMEFEGDLYVHPNYQNKGIEKAMLQMLKVRSIEDMKLSAPESRVIIRSAMSVGDENLRNIHESEGYLPVRYSWRMEISFETPPAIAAFPPNIELRPFDLEKDARAVFEATEDAFSEHWGHTPISFENWKHSRINVDFFDPALWFIAWDGNKIAGTSLCRYRSGIGYVNLLGVLKPYRKQGLGLALLQHSFREFFNRGTKTIGLGVDASNPTGATRLYERAGMKIASEYVFYEKELRKGE